MSIEKSAGLFNLTEISLYIGKSGHDVSYGALVWIVPPKRHYRS